MCSGELLDRDPQPNVFWCRQFYYFTGHFFTLGVFCLRLPSLSLFKFFPLFLFPLLPLPFFFLVYIFSITILLQCYCGQLFCFSPIMSPHLLPMLSLSSLIPVSLHFLLSLSHTNWHIPDLRLPRVCHSSGSSPYSVVRSDLLLPWICLTLDSISDLSLPFSFKQAECLSALLYHREVSCIKGWCLPTALSFINLSIMAYNL